VLLTTLTVLFPVTNVKLTDYPVCGAPTKAVLLFVNYANVREPISLAIEVSFQLILFNVKTHPENPDGVGSEGAA